ncbi:MAG: hypothetical protein U5K99_06995 [Anaerolineales bacterium]|nr:hypothetical protein [Anaerolineales bacterium]
MREVGSEPKRILTVYYGLLQLAHLGTLTAAGLAFLKSGSMPFPAQPPTGGWADQALPFLLAMGGVDAAAAALGVWFVVKYLIADVWKWKIGVISITSALTSAVIFAAGTGASGAWLEHPLAYGGMVLVFAPLFILYYYLVREAG